MTVDIDRYDNALMMADSGQRGGVLLDIVRQVDADEGRALLAHWFNMCDAIKPWADGLLAEIRRCAPIIDSDRLVPAAPLVVYRGAWHDDDPSDAISWSLKQETAEQFCRIISGPRGWFLGVRRDDAMAVVWRAICVQPLGFITGRGEEEILSGGLLGEPTIISGLMTPEQAAEHERTGVLPWDA